MATEKLRLYNTKTQEKEVFKPIDKKMAGMYVCVSDARSAVVFDILRRYLRHLGYEVNYASNLTHFSDKLINQATKCHEKNPSDFSSHFFEDCLSDMSTLHCPQTNNLIHMVNIIEMIKKIIEKDSGYVVEGDVFFSVNKSPNYGQLSWQQLDHTDAGGECLVIDPKKRNPADFALWKATKPGEPNWESPWGLGRPGWHIGCSAMSTLYLSPRFDILGGGAYLKFPHHEHVISQTCAAYEDSGVTYRLHTAHVTNNNVEMENSLQNSVTIREITSKYHPLALRHFLMSAHYRCPLKYSVLQLESSSDTLVSVYQTLQDLTEALPPLLAAMAEEGEVYNQDEKVTNRIHKLKNHVEKYISDDLYTANILKGAFDDMMRFISRVINEHKTWNRNRLMPMVLSLIEVERAVREVLDVLGLLTTQIYSDFLKDMKQMALARVQIGAEEILQDKIDLEFCNGTVKKRLSPVHSLVPVELMQFVTPADNVVYYVRKSCCSESEAINEYEVLSILRGSVGVVQSVGNLIHECETFYAYFMEYAPAGTLYDEIRRHSNGLPIDIVRRYTRMILEGLQSLHNAGFVHGDLHSMNVLLFPSEGGLVAKITDFGRTKRIGDSSWWGFQKSFLGFQAIMSPESVSEGTTNEGHDVWAMGLLVKAMFSDAKAQKTMCHSEEEAGDLMNIVVSDPEASDFTSLCLVFDPDRRAKVNDLLQHRFLQIY